jgi:hypothetical protein
MAYLPSSGFGAHGGRDAGVVDDVTIWRAVSARHNTCTNNALIGDGSERRVSGCSITRTVPQPEKTASSPAK